MLDRICALLGFQRRSVMNGVHRDAGASVPSDGESGYAKGCVFIKTDGGPSTTFYVNEGDVSSCDFNAK